MNINFLRFKEFKNDLKIKGIEASHKLFSNLTKEEQENVVLDLFNKLNINDDDNISRVSFKVENEPTKKIKVEVLLPNGEIFDDDYLFIYETHKNIEFSVIKDDIKKDLIADGFNKATIKDLKINIEYFTGVDTYV